MFIPRLLLVSLLLLLLAADERAQDRQLIQQSAAEKRVALVIGNAAYETSPLKNPVNDARDMTDALRGSGFDVIHRENMDQNDMKRAIREFGVKIRDGGVALFYYAGHGLQVKRNNYLVPVDAKVQTEEEVEYETVDAGFVLAQMDSARTRLNIVILDACRNNPFARSFRSATNGLAEMDAPEGTLIAYATAPGSIASDGATGRNGLYTRELLRVMAIPNLSIEEAFKRVRISVHGLTQGKQIPWESSSLMGDFSFRQSEVTSRDNTRLTNQPPATDPLLVPNEPRDSPATDYERVFSQREVDQRAVISAQPKPMYTESARKDAIYGLVRVQAVLDRSGNVRTVKVISGSELGHGLPESAIAAARQIKFTPAIKDGRPVSVQVTLEYNFSLY